MGRLNPQQQQHLHQQLQSAAPMRAATTGFAKTAYASAVPTGRVLTVRSSRSTTSISSASSVHSRYYVQFDAHVYQNTTVSGSVTSDDEISKSWKRRGFCPRALK